MNYKNTIREMWIALGLISFIFLMTAAMASADTTLQPGENFTFVYVNVDNVSVDELFVCSAADNVSCAFEEIVIELSPGEQNVTSTGDNCKATASCSADDTDPELCRIDAVIEAGDDDYSNNGGACDVRVEVEDGYCSADDVLETYAVYETVKIERDRRSVHLSFMDDRESFPANASVWSYEFPVKLTCPKNLIEDELLDEEVALHFCKELLPLTVRNLGKTYDECLEKAEDCDARLDQLRDDCDNEKRGFQNDASKATSDLAVCTTEKTSQVDLRVGCSQDLMKWQDKAEGRFIMALFGWIFAFMFGVSTAVLGLTYWRSRK